LLGRVEKGTKIRVESLTKIANVKMGIPLGHEISVMIFLVIVPSQKKSKKSMFCLA